MSADVDYETRLRCDHPRCTARYPTSGVLNVHWQTARLAAARHGWSWHFLKGDLCPEHAAQEAPR